MFNLRQQALEAVSRNHAPSVEALRKAFPDYTLNAIAALLWLHIPKLGIKRLHQLLKHFEGDALWHLFWVPPNWAYEHFSERFSQFPGQLKNAWVEKQKEFQTSLYPLLERYQTHNTRWLTITDARYPTGLREIHEAPNLLFYQGPVHLLQETRASFSVVGTRKVSPYGRDQIQRILGELAGTGVPIISGLALGVDGVAHEAALHNELPTVAVLAGGLDIIYPEQHMGLSQRILKAGGLLVSEMPLGVPPISKLFPRRNRIIVGLAPLMWVVEGTLKSGTMVSARIALEESRDICVIPMDVHRPVAEGPVKLLKEGAIPITTGEDVLHLLGLPTQHKAGDEASIPAPPLTEHLEQPINPPERTELEMDNNDPQSLKPLETNMLSDTDDEGILSCLYKAPQATLHVDALAFQSGLTPSQLLSRLTLLELEGRVQREPGNHFRLFF
jgi:DNA processing protein